MNPQDVQLTDEAIKALFIEEPEDKQKAIKEAKDVIFSEFVEGVRGTKFFRDKKYLAKVSSFLVENLKVSEKDGIWLDLGIIVFPEEENKRYIVISSPFSYASAAILLIENNSLDINEISFNKLFELQKKNQYIKTETVQYIEEFLKPRPIIDRLDKEERDLFKGVF
jgi:hypothetical protein